MREELDGPERVDPHPHELVPLLPRPAHPRPALSLVPLEYLDHDACIVRPTLKPLLPHDVDALDVRRLGEEKCHEGERAEAEGHEEPLHGAPARALGADVLGEDTCDGGCGGRADEDAELRARREASQFLLASSPERGESGGRT